ncbi:adenylate/guanylate cyclase domain-containing protein [Pseudobythopirellula maris]|nr:adenylate/guanylate cyclase domain-containing protein [Pseudobythopirellula maris]
MFDLAIHSPRQHDQQRIAGGRVVLAVGQDGVWRLAETEAAAGGGRLVLSHNGNGFDAAGMPVGERLETPGSLAFTLGDVRFELSDANATRSRGARALQRLETDDDRRAADASGPASATLARWLEALSALNRWSASTPEFYRDAARFAVEPVGLDGAMILERDPASDAWRIVSSELPRPELGVGFDPTLLERLAAQHGVWFHGVEQPTDDGETPLKVDPRPAIVLAPVTDGSGELVGAVYAWRVVHSGNGRRGVRYLEANLVRLLADSVSSGVARLEQEAEAGRRRALLEQAFTRTVAQQIERDPAMLQGRRRDVSVLFADLRDFSGLCAELPTETTYELLGDVMDCLTRAVTDNDGVVIDYYGDGLSAMWNAPLSQPEHAEMACEAGLQMLAELPHVSERWADRMRAPLRLGVGVHTGPAAVGNIGSTQKIKYGPRGETVNLASRVEAATKRLGVPLVATAATARLLPSRLQARRLCRARLPGLEEAVELYSVAFPTTESRVLAALDRYERALSCYERGDWDEAFSLLKAQIKTSGPAAFLADTIRRQRSIKIGRRESDHDAPDTEPAVITIEEK